MMANYAALIAPLSISGSRLTDGTPNASGTVWFFQPGGNTEVNVYTDAEASAIVTQPVTLTSGGKLPSEYPDGIFATQPIRLLIQDVDGNTVTDNVYIPATAGNVGVNNDGWTSSTLDGALTALHTSTRGRDGKYLIALGQTERNLHTVITELCVSVKAFGALGDGNADDTTAIQGAIDFVEAAGGGIVFFPDGNYKVSSALTVQETAGVSIVGSGDSTITSTNATANGFTITNCDGLRIQDIDVSHATSSSGYAYSLTGCNRVIMIRAACGNISIGGSYLRGLSLSSCSDLSLFGCMIASTGGSNIGINVASSPRFSMHGGHVSASAGTAVAFSGTSGDASFHGVPLGEVSFALGLSGTGFDFFGCYSTSFTVATATIPLIRVYGGSPIASATSSATGAAQTPSLIAGKEVILTAASGGAGIVTVNAPAVLPGTDEEFADLYWDFVFKNAAGGAVTWTLNAVYVVTAAIPTTDAHTISVRFRWDRTTSELREVSRADTVT